MKPKKISFEEEKEEQTKPNEFEKILYAHNTRDTLVFTAKVYRELKNDRHRVEKFEQASEGHVCESISTIYISTSILVYLFIFGLT